ncbi:NADPH-dependent 7-cyano-7-deazaguanine reductase QueF [candidate division NPL-UPA2 bacterium Unc8]|uniref:NADPH-dependent 7-cyano-7-deazaguanine reductase n=1 Tax=candidate division NPL-UPA2 bacterium Unc8 TaxID=1980939 RepID=A0A399G082_UNCN2|nr:NADPH-dependent 7-cyano-7-deazaguanine reductase [Bacillota bacterium]MBT9147354.1 NADPH-dependent 7-cyano-7-deazaguanine reductase [Bacillota bacterium]RII00783.1 MAG: NADPH-dependent 7-cyano-7-deazaguanine reductase QueF [candidate division NPL-UPA2 bacterium Unc8]
MNKLTFLGKKIRGYPSSPDEASLETFVNKYSKRDYWITFHCPEFTSICPETAQPDFGTITIRYIPDKKCLEAKSLKLYLFSFRSVGIFNEDAVNKILDAVIKASSPRRAEVSGEFRPRGGISITVRATYPNLTSPQD